MKAAAYQEHSSKHWHKLILAGNIGLEMGDYNGAISCYAKAKRVAISMLKNHSNTKELPAMLVISYQNLVAVYKKKNDQFQANKELEQVHRLLFDYLNAPLAHSPQMTEALYRSISTIKLDIINAAKEHPTITDHYQANSATILN